MTAEEVKELQQKLVDVSVLLARLSDAVQVYLLAPPNTPTANRLRDSVRQSHANVIAYFREYETEAEDDG